MNKLSAFTNSLAVFNYALWRYPNSIVTLSSNGITFSVEIDLDHNDYESTTELVVLKEYIALGADISHLKPNDASYDIIVIRYRYDN